MSETSRIPEEEVSEQLHSLKASSSLRMETSTMEQRDAPVNVLPATHKHSRGGSASTLLRLAMANSQQTTSPDASDPFVTPPTKMASSNRKPFTGDDNSLFALGLVSGSSASANGLFGLSIHSQSHEPSSQQFLDQNMTISDDGKNTHKGRSSSLSALWKSTKKDTNSSGTGAVTPLQQYHEIQHISAPLPPGAMDDSFTFPVQQESLPLNPLLESPTAEQNKSSSTPNGNRATVPPVVSPSPSEKKRHQYSLRRMFLHRKSSSNNDHSGDGGDLSPSISAPWGLTVASFRPAPVPNVNLNSSESTLHLRQLSLENSILISRESDSNGLLAQSRARDMPVPQVPSVNGRSLPIKSAKLERSMSLGHYMISSEHPTADPAATVNPRRYEASTMCDKFVLPRPRLVAFTITPPSSPPDRATLERTPQATYSSQPEARVVGRASLLRESIENEGRGPSPALSGHRVLREGVERDREREEWATRARAAPGQALRMRLPSAGRTVHQDKKYQMARFAPQPVAFEPVNDLDAPSGSVGGIRKKKRSGSLGNITVGSSFTHPRQESIPETSSEESRGPLDSTKWSSSHKRRASEPTSTRRAATTTFLHNLAQTMRPKKPPQNGQAGIPEAAQADHIPDLHGSLRKASLPAPTTPQTLSHLDKPLPPEPIAQSEIRSSTIRHSVSSPNLRTLDLQGGSERASSSNLPSRDSAINLLQNLSVVDCLAHPLDIHRAARPPSTTKRPPSPIQISTETLQPVTEPFTPTRQAAWDQWHTMQPRSPTSPAPERLPLETVMALASRQLASPRQKRPSMEEAVNRARIANQLFGDIGSQSFANIEPTLSHSATVPGYTAVHASPGRYSDRLSSTTTGSQQRDYPDAVRSFSPRSPRTTQLSMATPGSTDSSPMPGASFEDIERDLFFSRPRRLWGNPVVLPSRENGQHQRIGSTDSSTGDPRQSKYSAGSISTRMALTFDEVSQDAHGTMEIATPNPSQNGHEKTRFPAISEEDRSSVSSDPDRIDGDENRNFGDHRWIRKGYLPRDTSSSTILNFNEVNAHQPQEIQLFKKNGITSGPPYRSSVIPESGRLDDPEGDDSTRNEVTVIASAESSYKDSSPPLYLALPSFIGDENDASSNSFANTFVAAQTMKAIQATAKSPVFSRQHTDVTTTSYATAQAEPF